ncbi:MAG: pilin [Nanoarchaeota archaeon]|nr:pilin [Nanoarchaeota archaeon]
MEKRKLINCIIWPLLAAIFSMPFISAADMNATITAQEKAQFDKILEPVMKIYHLLLYLVSAVAIIYAVYIGIQFMLSGSDAKKRDEAKHSLTYVGIGLLVIWAAPYVVQMLIG